ncbi:MAG: hypothetical protein Q4A17_06540 [Thermoguttaceae bacterium]|nr:hypothetical protein [Thermoguttaceae bacterium]
MTEITPELELRLTETEAAERFTSLDRLLPRASATLERLNELAFGARLDDGEDAEELTLQLACDTIRIMREFHVNNPVDQTW